MPLVFPDSPAPETIPDLSVVILNWNAREFLLDALHSLHQEWRHAIEIIVVDNDSQIDDSKIAIPHAFPRLKFIVNAENIGFARGNNAGLEHARGRYVLFLNPDTIVHEGALDTLIEWMDAHSHVGACGPKLLNSDGTLQPSCRAFPSIGAGFFRNTPLGRLWPNNPWTRSYLMQGFRHDREAKVDWLSGSALLARREALDRIALAPGVAWSPKYFMYCEDVDLCYRLGEAGWPCFYAPQAVITHRIGGSSDWAQGAMIRQHHASMLRFFLTHYTRGVGILWTPLIVLGIGARTLGAILKLYFRYFRGGSFAQMWRNRFGR